MANVDTFRAVIVDKAVEDIRRVSDLYTEGTPMWQDHVTAILLKLIEDWH